MLCMRGTSHGPVSVCLFVCHKWYQQLVRGRFVYDTYRTIEVTRSRHGWVHMFITHQPTVTLQLHNFDLFRTCSTSSFCTATWQLARFQLTRRIARSLGDSWASCIQYILSPYSRLDLKRPEARHIADVLCSLYTVSQKNKTPNSCP